MQSMQLQSTNYGADVSPAIFSVFHTGKRDVSFKTRQHWFPVWSKYGMLRNIEDYVGMELSLVPKVETVFVSTDSDDGKEYTVISVINERDPEVRAQVYAREKAIMDLAPGIAFNFRVISRMNRKLADVIDSAGKLAFQRAR